MMMTTRPIDNQTTSRIHAVTSSRSEESKSVLETPSSGDDGQSLPVLRPGTSRVALYVQVFLVLTILICFMTQSKYFHLICSGHNRRLTKQPTIHPTRITRLPVCRHIPAAFQNDCTRAPRAPCRDKFCKRLGLHSGSPQYCSDLFTLSLVPGSHYFEIPSRLFYSVGRALAYSLAHTINRFQTSRFSRHSQPVTTE